MALEAPFQSRQAITLGVSGLDLYSAVDKIPPVKLARMTNVARSELGALTSRPGLTSHATAGAGATLHHTIGRLIDVNVGVSRLIVGAGISVYQTASSGAMTLVDTGYSGSPVHFLTYRPPFSSQPWMFVADRNLMRKIRSTDALSLPIGLAPPNLFSGAAADPQRTTIIEDFEVSGWTNNTGTGAGAPTNALDGVNFKEGSTSVQFTTNNGGGATPYYQYWNKSKALDLSLVGGVAATDDDLIHIWIRVDRPDLVTEVKLYFVCSTPFNTATLPGTSTTLNTDAYVKAFRPSDFTSIYEASSTTIPTASTANSTAQTMQQLAATPDTRAALAAVVEQTDPQRAASDEIGPGRGAWTEFSALGRPVRRGDFRRIGTDTSRGWANVTGIVLEVNSTTTTNVNIWLDGADLRGSYNLDNSSVGTAGYDYRYTHYDPRTGAESNPSPEMPGTSYVSAVRQQVVVTMLPYGDAAVRQRIYRRGGALTNNWYFVGVNSSDGGAFTDNNSDLSIVAAATLETDNDAPVTTVNSSGTTISGQPVYALWGPVQDILFACGDPNRTGTLYWSKVGEPDSWPAANNAEVTSPSEPLVTGCVWGGQSFVFSQRRPFAVYPNLFSGGTVSATPTACTHGPLNPWCVAVGPTGIYFVSYDGVYAFAGGTEVNIADEDLHGLFHGETRNGYLPIDLTTTGSSGFVETIQLEIHDNELWFFYADTNGARRVLVYSLLYQFWRGYDFAVISGYSDLQNSGLTLRLGGTSGTTFTHSGTSDNGAAITANIRTGALDQGFPRQDKLYGDLILDVDRASTTITVTPLVNNEVTTLGALTLTTGSGRTRYTIDPFGTGPQQARNLSIDLSWSSSTQRPVAYLIAPSYIIQPDTTVGRYTDWSPEGRRTDKYVKGLILECDTEGATKTIELEADGVVQTSITATASGRRVLQFSFAQFRGRELRIHPTDSSNWKQYSLEWIFDEEPLQLSRWETQAVDHGIPTHHSLLTGLITIQSTANVTLTITGTLQPGTTFSDTYTIASTAGAKQKLFVPFNARKGVLWKYVFTSSAAFWLYKEESDVVVVPWGGAPTTAHPFGNSDNQGRDMRSSALTALASGGEA